MIRLSCTIVLLALALPVVAAPPAVRTPPLSTAKPGQKAVPGGALPIRTGYYAVNDPSCANSIRQKNGLLIDDRYLHDIDADYDLKPVRTLGPNRFRLGEGLDSIRITGPDSFIANEGTPYERRFLWCAARQPK